MQRQSKRQGLLAALHLVVGGAALVGTAVAWVRLGQADAATPRLRPPAAAPVPMPHVAVVIPARDEARGITRCLRSVVAQRLKPEAIWVVDDRSTDVTSAIVTALATAEPRIHLIAGQARPQGWASKNWALHQGISAALEATPEWVLLTDADTWHDPELLALAWDYATRQQLDLLSVNPEYDEDHGGAQLLRAAIGEFYSFVYGPDYPRLANDPQASQAALAMGQFILVRAAFLRAHGGYGHPNLRAALADDRALALQVKAQTGRAGFVDGPGLLRTQGYPTLRHAWQGHAHHLLPSVLAPTARPRTLLALLAHGLGTLFPVGALLAALVAAQQRGWRQARAPLVAYAPLALAGLLVRWRAVRLTRLPAGYILTGPVGALLVQGLIFHALLRRNPSINWKGQRYNHAS